ncbi:hypothetical protein [Sphingobium sp. Leaf26]|uniref:hypothetical protein n=1 Tax=Sphingobium sp. Leaf26 TaxID=1735693 RepID=UPI00138F64F1|nr:hypothetical protein [Sphingobium sp. Leaf26]
MFGYVPDRLHRALVSDNRHCRIDAEGRSLNEAVINRLKLPRLFREQDKAALQRCSTTSIIELPDGLIVGDPVNVPVAVIFVSNLPRGIDLFCQCPAPS